ncbi:MAG: LuxR C-terminal-related transcriptional regulator [Actinomycetota bacterium]
MSFSDRQVQNFFEVAKIVYEAPEPPDLCAMLATRICPEGELAKVYLAKLESDGIFRTVATFGYARETEIHKFQVGLDKRIPLADAYLRSEVILLNRHELPFLYPHFQVVDKRSPWESMAVTPTLGGGLVYVFRLQVPLEKNKYMSIYFESIANLLSFYPYVHDSYAVVEPRRVLNNHSYDESSTGMRDKSLTARQRTILELIQEGQTNLQIAGVIGYSESLV